MNGKSCLAMNIETTETRRFAPTNHATGTSCSLLPKQLCCETFTLGCLVIRHSSPSYIFKLKYHPWRPQENASGSRGYWLSGPWSCKGKREYLSPLEHRTSYTQQGTSPSTLYNFETLMCFDVYGSDAITLFALTAVMLSTPLIQLHQPWDTLRGASKGIFSTFTVHARFCAQNRRRLLASNDNLKAHPAQHAQSSCSLRSGTL